MNSSDYKKLFEQSPSPEVVIDTAFTIIAASDLFLKASNTVRENIINRNLFEVFPDNPSDLTANSESIIRASLNRVLTTKAPDTLSMVRYDIPNPDGVGFTSKYWRHTHTPILDAFGQVKYIIQCGEDVTENKILVDQLELEKKMLKHMDDSERRLNMMLMQSPFAFALLKGKDRIIAFANDRLKETWGKGKDIEGKPLLEVLPELKDTPFPALIDEVYKTGMPYYANETLAPKHIKGQKDVYYNFVYQPYREADETISGITIIAAEVTASVMVKKALAARHELEQNALKQIADSEKRYNMMLMKSPFAFAVLKGKNMVITLANDSVKEMWGKGKDLEGKPLLEVLPEIKDSEFPGLLDKVYTTGTPFHRAELLAPIFRNGKLEDVYFNFVYQPYLEADETISGVTIIAIEVTNEVIAKQKIKDSQQQLQNIFMQAPFALNIYEGKELVISLANKLFCEIIGKTESEILGKKLFEAFPETAAQGLDKILSDIFSTGTPFKGNEFPVHFLKHGNEFKGYFDFIYQPIFDYNKNVSGVINVAIDVTDKVLARKKIEESEQRFHNLIYTSPSAIGILSGEELVITIANEPIIEIWGKGKEIVGKKYFEALPELAEQGYKKVFDQVYKTGIPFNAVETPVTILQNGVTTRKYYNFILYPQKNINGEINGIGIIATEVTSQAESNLRIKEGEERFRSLADNVPMHIFILAPNAEASVSYFNKYWLDYTGQTMEEALGRTWDGIIHPDDVQSIMDVYVPSFEKRQPYILPAIRVRRYDGAYRWFQVHGNPRYLPNGEFMGFIGAGFDIHESKLAVNALKESEEHFRLMADLMPAKISNANPDGDVTYFNKHWLDYAGYSFEELRDFGYHKIMHPDELDEFQKRFKKAAETGSILEMEMQFMNKHGDYRWHLNLASPIKDENGHIKMWVGSTTDIHEQKEQEAVLENAVKSRTRELEIMNKELENANKDLTSFTYVSSHDLQEPLRKIQNFGSLILHEEEKNLSKKGKEYLERMMNTALRMRELIEDLLKYSRVRGGEQIIEEIDLNQLLKEATIDFEVYCEKNATIETSNLYQVKVIPFQFRQLLQNLISNSLKFAREEVPPHITITSKIDFGEKLPNKKLLPTKKYCHIIFSDNGIGFDPQYKDLIFEVFQRLHTKSEYTGTGIGLAICKRIVENLNGFMTATGKLNEGVQFDIFIPA